MSFAKFEEQSNVDNKTMLRSFVYMMINEDAESFTPLKDDFEKLLDKYQSTKVFDEIHIEMGIYIC